MVREVKGDFVKSMCPDKKLVKLCDTSTNSECYNKSERFELRKILVVITYETW